MSRKKPSPPVADEEPPNLSRPGTVLTREQWETHRAYYIEAEGFGSRPDPWWRFEKNMAVPGPPCAQARILYDMGELRGAELKKVKRSWRLYYDDANHWTMEDRTSYWRWAEIPPELIAEWDAETGFSNDPASRPKPLP
jgi:hypothetical protein